MEVRWRVIMKVRIQTGVVAIVFGCGVMILAGGSPPGWGQAVGLATPASADRTTAQLPRLWGGLDPGPFAVGFSVILQLDDKRTLPATNLPRPILISLWYPALRQTIRDNVSYRDYIAASAGEGRNQPPTPMEQDETVEAYSRLVGSTGVEAGSITAWLSSPMAATRDAPPADGRYPLIVILPGTFHTSYHHAILAEFLASHGYVIAIAPSQSRLDGPPHDEGDLLPAARQQEADVKVLLRRMAEDERVARGPVGLVAHSFGARAAFLLALDEPVAGLVSLDGGIANAEGGTWLDDVSFDAAEFDVPVLHIYEATGDVVRPDFRLLNSLVSAERILVRVDDFRHVEFSSLGMVFGLVPGMGSGEESPSVIEKSRSVMELTLWFLERTLHHQAVGDPPPDIVVEPWIDVARLGGEQGAAR
jgi:dienelactone hydrolase